jgi:cyclomaltodextrin glucanotransferase
MTFYDNHDMPRLAARDEGFIDAHNWLFTARGIPVVYYGSEIAFMTGTHEHEGNRNYFGSERVAQARTHRIRAALAAVAGLRARSPALQRGLQLNLEFRGNRAAFLRVYQRDGAAQLALVLLNKGDGPERFTIDRWPSPGTWRDALAGGTLERAVSDGALELEVPAHGLRVLLHDGAVQDAALAAELDRAMAALAAGSGR